MYSLGLRKTVAYYIFLFLFFLFVCLFVQYAPAAVRLASPIHTLAECSLGGVLKARGT